MISYICENLFLYKTFNSKRGIPQRNIYEVLPTEDIKTIKLGNLKAGRTWFWPQASNTVDIVNLCLICQHGFWSWQGSMKFIHHQVGLLLL